MRCILVLGFVLWTPFAYAGSKATVATKTGDLVEGTFRGATDGEITIEVAGQPLAISLDKKRLELLELKKAQLGARRISDPALEAQIEALAEKVRAYVAPRPAAPEPPRGLIQLKKKQSDGTFVPAGA